MEIRKLFHRSYAQGYNNDSCTYSNGDSSRRWNT